MPLLMQRWPNGTCSYGVGLESGMYPEKEIETGYLNVSVCAIYNGEEYAIGLGPAFETPEIVAKRALLGEEHGHMQDVFGKNAKGRDGMIYRLSNERLHRCDIEENGVMMALLKIVNQELYKKNK